ncbi:MAG: DeoR/GlpR family DNA-binding transcription regulator [Candidatus Omnitrophica bacterium]|nr:DeoR/GlpR family DNA-binding transcription regulator [Candidatus Omnitrophota bacterium]
MGINSLKRKEMIRSAVAGRGEVLVSELVKRLGVSEVTIRRYLEELEKEGVLTRTYGGAIKNEARISPEFLFTEKSQRNLAEKKVIARAAVNLVREGETIFLDSGTTILELSRLLKKSRLSFTVATTSLPVASELFPLERIKVLLLGGFLRRELFDFFGPFSREELSRLTFNQAFLGVDGISGQEGLTTTDSVTALIEETVIKKSQKINILADHSKIGHIALIPYGNIQGIAKTKRLITDSGAAPEELRNLKKMGLEVIVVKV